MWNTLPIYITVCKFLLLFSTYFPCTIEYMTPYWVILRGNYSLYNFFGWNYLRGNGPAGNCPGGRWPQDNLPVAIKWGGQFFLHPVYAISFKQLSIFSFFWARKCRANYNWIFALVFLLLTVNIFRIFFFYFYCWLWTSKYWLGCLLKLTKIMPLSKIIPDSGPLFQINLELNIWSATYNLPVCLFWIILFSFRLISYALETVYKRKHFHMMPLHVQKQPPDLFC